MTNNEAGFVSPSLKQLILKQGIEKVETPVYRAKANGQVERYHNTKYLKLKTHHQGRKKYPIKELHNNIHTVTGHRPLIRMKSRKY